MHLHHIPARDDIARAEVLQQHAATHTDLLRIDLHQISGLCNSPIFRLANGPWPFSQFPPRLAQPGRLGRLVKHPAPLPIDQDASHHGGGDAALLAGEQHHQLVLAPTRILLAQRQNAFGQRRCPSGLAHAARPMRAVLPEVVPQEGLMPAIALNGIEFNLARAIGPALGGFLIAALGITAVFSLNAASYLGVLWVIARWKRPPHQTGALRETMSGAIRAAVRYTRNAPEILTVLGRIGSVMFFASAFWALLPTVAHELRRSATLYGLLLTVFGVGAVLGAMALQRTRSL